MSVTQIGNIKKQFESEVRRWDWDMVKYSMMIHELNDIDCEKVNSGKNVYVFIDKIGNLVPRDSKISESMYALRAEAMRSVIKKVAEEKGYFVGVPNWASEDSIYLMKNFS